MAEVVRVRGRPETAGERALSEWFYKQSLNSLDNLENAARSILGLVTALVGVLLGVLTIAAEKLPAYLALPIVRTLGALSVAALLAALMASLAVVFPQEMRVSSHRPDEQAQAFETLLGHKSRWLKLAAIAFAAGVDLLGVVLVIALLHAG